MKAWQCSQYGPPEVLEQTEIPQPETRNNELLIKVHARPVTVADCRIRGFRVPPSYRFPARIALGFTRPRKSILGSYFAGVVEEAGDKTTRFKVGDRIFGSTNRAFGTYAEYVCLRETCPIQYVPKEMNFEAAAASPWGAGTALYFLQRAPLQEGMEILINGASGSIGLAAIQLSKFYQLKVTAVCSGKNKDLVLSVGADRAIDYQSHNFTADESVYDLVFDTVGNHPVRDLCRCIKTGGSLLHVIATPDVQRQARRHVAEKSIQFLGGDTTVNQQLLDFILERLTMGDLRPIIDSLYSFDQLVEAHHRVDSGRKTGDVIVHS